MTHPFDLYSDFTDLKKLNEYSMRPLRKSKRVNLIKSSVDQFRAWAKAEGWQTEEVPWCTEGFFIDREDHSSPLGKDVLHMLGHTYLQEAASMLPVALLDPKPEEHVLDMSAAPGSKTTQMASQMGNRGVIIANDASEKRLWALASNLQRCGVMNTIIVHKVGQWFARHMAERFDKVLIDAPCTAQGTLRKDPRALEFSSADNIGKMANLQRALLESAIHATKVGGRVVYSTCTLTTEENEEVVSFILNKYFDQVVALPIERLAVGDERLACLKRALEDSHVVQEYVSKTTRSSLAADRFPTLRLWPQTYDTEGFFCAVFEKRKPTMVPAQMDWVPLREKPLPKSRVKEMKEALLEWYGTDFMQDDEVLLDSGKQLVITTKEVLEFALPVKNILVGLPFGKQTRHGLLRISHEMATLRGLDAAAQLIPISQDQFQVLLKGLNVKSMETESEAGDVFLACTMHGREFCIGRGLLKNGDILNRLPREIVQMHA